MDLLWIDGPRQDIAQQLVVVARSNAEANIKSMAHRVCEMLWLKKLLKELGYDFKDSMRL